ncbi:hypothetical protein KIPB_008128, partial [Kipferlia bialata]
GEAEADSLCDFSFHIFLLPPFLRHLQKLVDMGYPSFKIYTVYNGLKIDATKSISQCMESIANAKGMAMVHSIS